MQPPPPHSFFFLSCFPACFFFFVFFSTLLFHLVAVNLPLSPLHLKFFPLWRTCYPQSSRHNQPLFLRLMRSIGARSPFCTQTPALRLALIGIDCWSAQYVKPSRNNTCTHSMNGKRRGSGDVCACIPSLLISQCLSFIQISSSYSSKLSTAMFVFVCLFV